MNIKLYSTHCPRCKVLEMKLAQKNIEYEMIDNFDVQELIDVGFKTAPVLCVDGNYMDFTKAVAWIKGAAAK